MFSVELARDLTQALALGVSSADVSDQLGREPRLATGPRSLANSRRLPALDQVALELGDGDQPCTPFGLHCCDCRDDAAIERCEADADRLGGLLARVGESLDPTGRAGRLAPAASVMVARDGALSRPFFAAADSPSAYIVQQSCG